MKTVSSDNNGIKGIKAIQELTKALEAGGYNVAPSKLREGCVYVVLDHCACGCHEPDSGIMHCEPCCRSCKECGAERVVIGSGCYCDVWKDVEREKKLRGR